MLSLRNVTLRFGGDDDPLLSSVSLDLRPGEITGVTGPSGGGKTLLGLVAADVIPRVIPARLDGSVERTHGRQPESTSAAVVFQDPSFQLLARTVRDELLYTPRRFGWDMDGVTADLAGVVGSLDLGHLLDRHPRDLSTGEVQRVAVGAALMQRPALLVLDEPTQYQDLFHVERTLETVRRHAEDRGTAVLLIEHHTSLLERFCTRTLRMDGGGLSEWRPVEPVFPVNGLPVVTASSPCFDLKGVGFSYSGGGRALDDVTLSIKRGESVAVLGPNGSGKSTLARLLCGLSRPDSGTISRPGGKGIDGSTGYVMQDPDRQIFAPTVFEECAFAPRNHGVPEERYRPAIDNGLGRFGMDGFCGRDPLSLSCGEKRRMNVVSVTAADPDAVIFDEPTCGLDHDNRLRLLDRIRRWNADGLTVVVITHDLPFARAACRRGVFMNGGRIVRDGPLHGMEEKDVRALYLG